MRKVLLHPYTIRNTQFHFLVQESLKLIGSTDDSVELPESTLQDSDMARIDSVLAQEVCVCVFCLSVRVCVCVCARTYVVTHIRV
jgi:hypothetical protein